MTNRNSKAIESLVAYINDTKPYHSKLTEVVEEYLFTDSLNVRLVEATRTNVLNRSTWGYGGYSTGNSQYRSHLAHRVQSPALTQLGKNVGGVGGHGRYRQGVDELTELAGIPFVYPKKSSLAVGIADAWLERGTGAVIEPLVESLDLHDVHGSFDLEVKQVFKVRAGQPEEFAPLWRDAKLAGLVAEATTTAQVLALDKTNPTSAGRRLHSFVSQLKAHLVANPPGNPQLSAYVAAIAAADSILAELDIPSIPRPWVVQGDSFVLAGSYDALINGAEAAGVVPPAGFAGWTGTDTAQLRYVDQQVSALLSNILFAFYTDADLNLDGRVRYAPAISDQYLTISSVVVGESSSFTAFTLEVLSSAPGAVEWKVTAQPGIFLGTFTSGDSFSHSSSAGSLSFNSLAVGTTSPPVGHQLHVTPVSKLAIHPSAALERWSLIKTNPIAYTRPVLVSPRHPHLVSTSGAVNQVTLLDSTLPTGELTLTATSATQLQLRSTVEPAYTGSVTVNVPYNDGRVAFTVVNGSAVQLAAGDKFYVSVLNEPARAKNLDLYYGYDLDSYDNNSLVYNNTDPAGPNFNAKIEFKFDSRFGAYDPSWLNLQVTDSIVDGRSFRLVAVPNFARPISTLKRDGSGPSEQVDLADETSGLPPDPALNGDPVYSMSTPALEADLLMYYADSFALEYSDDGFLTRTVVDTIPVGQSFSSQQLGVSFTLAGADKPYIAVAAKLAEDGSSPAARTNGGDVFAFVAENKPPALLEPSCVRSLRVARLIPHADGFFNSIDAAWTVTFTSPTTYTLAAVATTGAQVGAAIPGYPVVVNTAEKGLSYHDGRVQYTLFPGAAGFSAGDKFTFTTFKNNPSILVHGSVSGWQPPAKQGEWYWNGKIGFMVAEPKAEVLVLPLNTRATKVGPATWAVGAGTIEVVRLRRDAPDVCYTLKQVGARYSVSTTTHGLVGNTSPSEPYVDQYVTIKITGQVGSSVAVNIIADDVIRFWNATDSVLVKPPHPARFPATGDFTVIQKAEDTQVAVTLDYSIAGNAPNINDLGPVSRLQLGSSLAPSDFDPTSGTKADALAKAIPEESIFNNWISTTTERYVTPGNKANFFDDAPLTLLRSATTGALVATISSSSATNLNEPVYFTWDEQFFNQYVPLNTQFNIVTYGTGLNDVLKVRLEDKAVFLVSGGPILEDALFNEDINLNLAESHTLNIGSSYSDSFGVVAQDGPFTEFMSGYDNHPFDAELTPDALDPVATASAAAQYDTGLPLTDYFTHAKELAAVLQPTAAQRQLLDQLTSSFSGLLNPGGLEATSLSDFITNFNADAYRDAPDRPTLGIPKVGLAMDVVQRSSDSLALTSFSEALTFTSSIPTSGFGSTGFGAGGFSQLGTAEAKISVSGPLPIGSLGASSFAEAVTPVEVVGHSVSTIEVTFMGAPAGMATPRFYVWLPNDTNPFQVTAVQVISNGVFRFSIAQPSEVKIFVL